MSMLSDLPSRIKHARELRNMTQQGFAELLGVTQVTVARWESGVPMKLETLARIASATELPITWFFTDDDVNDFPSKYYFLSIDSQRTINDMIDFLFARERENRANRENELRQENR